MCVSNKKYFKKNPEKTEKNRFKKKPEKPRKIVSRKTKKNQWNFQWQKKFSLPLKVYA